MLLFITHFFSLHNIHYRSLVKRYSQQLIQIISYLPSNRSIDGFLSFHFITIHIKKENNT